jgi:hypothetical protein
MKLAWKQIKVLGVRITLPGIVIEVQPLSPEVAARLRHVRAEMVECKKCRSLYLGNYPLALITHLTEEHGVDSFTAIGHIEDLGRKKLAKHAERRAEALAVAAN